jgi:hypothetical protein
MKVVMACHTIGLLLPTAIHILWAWPHTPSNGFEIWPVHMMVMPQKYAAPTLICQQLLEQHVELNRDTATSSGTTLLMLCVQSFVLIYLGVRWMARLPAIERRGEWRDFWRQPLLPVDYLLLQVWCIYDWGLLPFNYMLQGLATLAVLTNHLLRPS